MTFGALTIIIPTCGCQTINEFIYGKFETNDEYVIDMVAEQLNLQLNEATLLEKWDAHGGFHGDGDPFLKLFSADDLSKQMPLPEKTGDDGVWNPLPLSSTANGWLYTGSKAHEYVPLETMEYWFFLMDGPFNFHFGAYDKEESIVYYYEWDV